MERETDTLTNAPADEVAIEKQKRFAALDLRRLSIEMMAITFGVVLGLFLNEWRMDVRDSRDVASAENAIVAELTANFQTIERARNYHEIQYREAVRILHTNSEDYYDYRGLAAPNTTRSALDAAIATGHFARIDSEIARRYMQLYNEIDEVRETQQNYARAGTLSQRDSYRGFLRFAATAFSDMLYAEDDALHKIGEALGLEPVEGWWITKPKIDAEYPNAFRPTPEENN